MTISETNRTEVQWPQNAEKQAGNSNLRAGLKKVETRQMRTGARNVLGEEITSEQMFKVMEAEQGVHRKREGESINIRGLLAKSKDFSVAMLEYEKENEKIGG